MAEESEEKDKKEEAPKKKLPLMLIAVGAQMLVVIVAAALMAKTVLFSKAPDLSEKNLRERAIASIHDDSSEIQSLPLEQFSMNFPMKHSLKATVDLEVSSEKTAKLLKHRMAAVRARVLNVLSTQSPEKVATLQGKLSLKDAIREAINEELVSEGETKGVVRDVYFMEFVLI